MHVTILSSITLSLYYYFFSKVKEVINARDITGKTPLHLALINDKWPRADKILKLKPGMYNS